MKKELSEAITEVITKAIASMESGADFLEQQLPDYVEQLLIWYGFHSLFTMIMSILIIGLSLRFVRIRYRICEASQKDDTDDEVILFMFSIGVLVLAIINGLVLINLDWLQIWIAPKVWLIEYTRTLAY